MQRQPNRLGAREKDFIARILLDHPFNGLNDFGQARVTELSRLLEVFRVIHERAAGRLP